MTATLAAIRRAHYGEQARAYWCACRAVRLGAGAFSAAVRTLQDLPAIGATDLLRRRATEALASLPAGYSNEEIVG